MKPHILGSAVVAATLMTSMLTAAPASAADPGGIDWQPCADATEVDCATLRVPLDYADPHGATIDIGLARRPATDPRHRIGSLLMDPGGPGGSGVEAVQAGSMFSEAVDARFDVIGFDPRGINTSTPITCDRAVVDAVGAASIPTDQESFEERAALNAELADNCRASTGPLYDHVDTPHVARDMDRIRQALGEDMLTFVGYSYGSLMGQQYAELFPDRVRAMVLDGNMDHSMTSTYDFLATETAAVERNFTRFAHWCDTDERCALHGRDVVGLYGELRDAARAGELTDPRTGNPIGFHNLSNVAFNANFPQSWQDLSEDLRTLGGTGSRLSHSAMAVEEVTNPAPAIWCQDWDFPIADYSEWAELTERLAAEYPTVQWSAYNANALNCIGHPDRATNPQRPVTVPDGTPIVMLGNLNDFATVYPWSLSAAEQTGATLITYEGYNHTVYAGRSACVDRPVDAFLIDLVTPRQGISCPSVDSPNDGAAAAVRPLPYRG